ncbi:sodium:solute symporter family protein [Desulfurococcaceae archaeon MEX13E-LK6-19]|nr:sodium:solute symporter family protein [Desulfurococcaceae archaeon MEX13E-LK6-19]
MEYLALIIIAGWLGLTSIVGYVSTKKGFEKLTSVDAWFVAGRTLGLLILWLSLGANIYSAYTFLGLPGTAAREGARVWGITLYGMISYLIGFLLIPSLWKHAKNRNWLTLADAFEDLYGSKGVGAFVAITGALWSIPYIQLQIQGIGYIIEVAGYGMFDPVTAKLIAFLLIAVFTIVGGLMSVAFINALQGAIMLFAIWLVGLLAPIIAFGGYDRLFAVLQDYAATQPEGGVFSLYLRPQDLTWMVTLMLTAPLAFWLWPNRVQNIFGGKDIKTIKKNMVLVGVYQVSQIPAIMVGLTAIALFATGMLALPVYKKPYSDMAFMLVARQLFPPWFVGIVGAGALAASISTAAAILHVCGALFSRNAYQRVFKPNATGKELVFAARLFTAAIAIISLILALYAPGILIYLLLIGYAGIVQFFPQYVIGLLKPGLIGKRTAVAGMSVGMITVGLIKTSKDIASALAATPLAPVGEFLVSLKRLGFYAGFYGLIANLIVIAIGIVVGKLAGK